MRWERERISLERERGRERTRWISLRSNLRGSQRFFRPFKFGPEICIFSLVDASHVKMRERERERDCNQVKMWLLGSLKGQLANQFPGPLLPAFNYVLFGLWMSPFGPWSLAPSTFKRTSRRVWKCFILKFFYLVQVYLSKLTDLATYWTYLQHQEAKNQNPPLCFSDKRVHLYICLKHMCMPLGRFIPYCSRL
jgi:hypothetical protein